MRGGRLGWLSRTAAVVVPVALGIPMAVDGAMTVYAGYASMEWPAAKATVTRFRAVPITEADADYDDADAGQSSKEDRKWDEALTEKWQHARRRVDRLFNSQHTLDFTVEFEYTLPDGNQYVGTSRKDANFPSRLDLECPSCMMQAETIIDFFGQPGKEFFLFYHPRPASAPLPASFRTLTTRKAKDSAQQEGRYPLYSLDAGMIAPTAYERMAVGSTLAGVGLLGLLPHFRAQSWTQRLTTQRGLFPVFCLAVGNGAAAFGLSFLLESRLAASANGKPSDGPPT